MAKANRQYGASNVLVRVYEKDLLSPDYFERLLNADNYDEALQILDETHYHKYIQELGINHLEDALTEALVDAYDKILEISPSSLLPSKVIAVFKQISLSVQQSVSLFENKESFKT